MNDYSLRDIEYLDSIYESLDEAKGIKTTILKPFYDKASPYEAQRNPKTRHNELGTTNTGRRRFARYDYGKADYEKITAEEAIQYIQADKYNIQNLRIILDKNDTTSLVEYEIRDNGKPYPIYRSVDSFELNGKTYRNIGYATSWKNIFDIIRMADVIYKTDEYAHPLYNDPEVQASREKGNEFVQITSSTVLGPNDPGYDGHDTFRNMYNNSSIRRYASRNLDTGAHDLFARFGVYSEYFKKYIKLKTDAENLYRQIDQYRRALKKLESEKDDLDPEIYERKKARWIEKYNELRGKYSGTRQIDIIDPASGEIVGTKGINGGIMAQLKAEEQKLILYIDDKTAEFQNKFRENIREVSSLIRQCHQYELELQGIKDSPLSAKFNTFDYSALQRNLRQVLNELTALQEQLNQAIIESGVDSEVATDAQARLDTKMDTFEQIIQDIDTWNQNNLEKYRAKVDRLESQLRDLQARRDELRPHTAAERARRQAKNATPELDNNLDDLVTFDDNI